MAGIGAGALAALAFGALLKRLTFGVSPSDPVTLATVAATLVAVAVTASLLPGYRAAKVDPLKATPHELERFREACSTLLASAARSRAFR